MFSLIFQVDVQLDLLIDDTVTTSCTISSDGAERTQNGISVPIDFVMKSNSRKCLLPRRVILLDTHNIRFYEERKAT